MSAQSMPGQRTRALVAFIGIALGAAIAFITTVVIGRGAGAVAVGQYFQFIAVFSVLSTIVTFGSDTGLVRFLAADRATGRVGMIGSTFRVAAVPILIVGATIALVILGVSTSPLGAGLIGTFSLPGVILGAPFLLIAALLAVMLGGLRGLGRIVEFTVVQNVLLPTTRLVGVVVVIAVGFTLENLLLTWLLPLALAGAVAYLMVRRHLASLSGTEEDRSPLAADAASSPLPTRRREFWTFASARGVSSVLEIILEWIDVLAVALFLGPQAAGIYAVVTRCVRVGQMVDHAVRTVSSPLISASLALADQDGTRKIFAASGRVLVLLAWPFYLVLIIHAPTVLTLFGSGFTGGAGALRIISGAMLIAVTAGGVQSMLLMGGRSQWQVANKAVALAVAVSFNLTLVPLLGIIGAAIAWASAVLVDCALASWQVATRMGIRLPLSKLQLPAFLASACFGGPLAACALALPATVGFMLLGIAGSTGCLLISALLARRSLGLSLRHRAVEQVAAVPART